MKNLTTKEQRHEVVLIICTSLLCCLVVQIRFWRCVSEDADDDGRNPVGVGDIVWTITPRVVPTSRDNPGLEDGTPLGFSEGTHWHFNRREPREHKVVLERFQNVECGRPRPQP